MYSVSSEKAADDFRYKIERILDELLNKNAVEIFGNLKIEIAGMDTLAMVKGDKIYLNGDARKYPKYVLKYIMAHELAHLVVKRHTRKFWGIVKHIYPQYEKGKIELARRLTQTAIE